MAGGDNGPTSRGAGEPLGRISDSWTWFDLGPSQREDCAFVGRMQAPLPHRATGPSPEVLCGAGRVQSIGLGWVRAGQEILVSWRDAYDNGWEISHGRG